MDLVLARRALATVRAIEQRHLQIVNELQHKLSQERGVLAYWRSQRVRAQCALLQKLHAAADAEPASAVAFAEEAAAAPAKAAAVAKAPAPAKAAATAKAAGTAKAAAARKPAAAPHGVGGRKHNCLCFVKFCLL